MKNQLALFQLVDSAFPTGAFSHSFGLETAFKEGDLNGPDELYEWLDAYISASLAPMEGVAVYISYHAIQNELAKREWSERIQADLQRLDRKLTLGKIPAESREGNIKIGKRYLKIVRTLYPESQLEHYDRWIHDKLCFGNPAIVHGWISAYLGIAGEDAIFTHLYASVNNLLQAALRMTTVGQTDAQLILQRLYSLMEDEVDKIIESEPNESDLYNCAVLLDTEAMRHETLYSRLFMS